MFGTTKDLSLLDTFFCPDVSELIKEFTTSVINKYRGISYEYTNEGERVIKIFNDKLVEKCIKTGDYLWYTAEIYAIYYCYGNGSYEGCRNVSLIQYLFRRERLNDIRKLLSNYNDLPLDHFRNYIKDEGSEIKLLCINGMEDILLKIKGLTVDHLKYYVYWLCRNKMYRIIKSIEGATKYVINKGICGRTGLYYLCKYGKHDIITSIKGLTARHYKCVNKPRRTALYILCVYGRHDIIVQIKGLQLSYFRESYILNHEDCGLHYLCKNGMRNTIMQISKIVGKNWERKRYDSDITTKYMDSFNAFLLSEHTIKIKTREELEMIIQEYNRTNDLKVALRIEDKKL